EDWVGRYLAFPLLGVPNRTVREESRREEPEALENRIAAVALPSRPFAPYNQREVKNTLREKERRCLYDNSPESDFARSCSGSRDHHRHLRMPSRISRVLVLRQPAAPR